MRYIITIANNRITSINSADVNLTIEQGFNTTVKIGTYDELMSEIDPVIENLEYLTNQHLSDQQ